MNSTTTIFSTIDRVEVIGHDLLVFSEILHKEYQLKTAMDIEKHPRISRELSKRWRIIDMHKLYFKETDDIYEIQIRKYKSTWAMITRSKIDKKLILLKLVKQTINRITHPCFLGTCGHIEAI